MVDDAQRVPDATAQRCSINVPAGNAAQRVSWPKQFECSLQK
jgi:hypothetical protein